MHKGDRKYSSLTMESKPGGSSGGHNQASADALADTKKKRAHIAHTDELYKAIEDRHEAAWKRMQQSKKSRGSGVSAGSSPRTETIYMSSAESTPRR